MRVGVVTDSSCDLPAATLQKARIEVVPLRLLVGDEVYLDWRDVEPATLYDWMQAQGVRPTVRSPEPEDFMDAYRRSFQRFESLVSIHISPSFSRTFANAQQAAAKLGITNSVLFIDSGSAGAGLAEIVLEAARLARRGASSDEVRAATERARDEMYGVFSPTDASWSGSSGPLEGLRSRRHRALGHRPLIGMSGGSLARLGWQRPERVPQSLVAAVENRFGAEPVSVTVAYGGAEKSELDRLREAVELSGLVVERGRVQLIGPAVGASLGPGSATIFARPVGRRN